MKAGERVRCDGCDAPLIAAVAADGGGGPYLVELEPHRAGSVLLFKRRDGVPAFAPLSVPVAGALSAYAVPLRRMHATCPGPNPYADASL